MREFVSKVENTYPLPSGYLGADEDNVRFDELNNAVTTAGITLDDYSIDVDSDLFMLAQAMAKYASGGVFCTETSLSANNYIFALGGDFVEPQALFTGLRILFYPANSSTGPSTAKAFGSDQSKVVLRPDGSAIKANDILANRLCQAIYDEALDSGNGGWRLSPWAIPPSVLSATAVPISGEGISVGAGYSVALNVGGLVASIPVGADYFSFWSQTLQHHYHVTLDDLIAIIRDAIGSRSLTSIAPLFMIQERRASGVLNPFSHGIWKRRPLSDIVVNQIATATLNGSNQIVLPAGTYRIDWSAVVARAAWHWARLVNVTTGQVLGYGAGSRSVTSAANIVSSSSDGTLRVTLTDTTTTLELQHYSILPPGGGPPYFGDPTVFSVSPYHVDSWIAIVKES